MKYNCVQKSDQCVECDQRLCARCSRLCARCSRLEPSFISRCYLCKEYLYKEYLCKEYLCGVGDCKNSYFKCNHCLIKICSSCLKEENTCPKCIKNLE